MNSFEFGFFDELQKLANYQPYYTPESLQANAKARLKSGYHKMDSAAKRAFDADLDRERDRERDIEKEREKDRENYRNQQMAQMRPGLSNPATSPKIPMPK